METRPLIKGIFFLVPTVLYHAMYSKTIYTVDVQ